MQTQEGGFTQAGGDPGGELSPGVQVGRSPLLQVIEHFGHGGGPSTLQEEGCVRSHFGVAVGEATLGRAALEVSFSAPIADTGENRIATNKIIAAIIVVSLQLLRAI